MQLSSKEIILFQEKIFSWYEANKRDLPWRAMPEDISLQERAYRIFVSEVMSQQTQIQRVVIKYEAWIQQFPTIEALAQSSIADVLEYWSGLGYNRRALNLKKTAEMIVHDYQGVFPQTEKDLVALPGIGKYTARAILCFAFDQQIAVVDTNVRKVILTEILTRHLKREGRGNFNKEIAPACNALRSNAGRLSEYLLLAMTERDIEAIAQNLLPSGRASEWNQALMDYAAAVLKQEKIPIPKQSKFVGSHRYYRGQVLKVLLQKKKVLVSEMGRLIKEEYQIAEEDWLKRLLHELQEEGFIMIKNEMVMLAS